MDETLKRRLIGAGLLLMAAFLLVSMLPEPRLRPLQEEDVRVVTIDLQAPETVAGEAVELQAQEPAPGAAAQPRVEPQAPSASAARASEEGAPPELDDDAEPAPAPAPALVERKEPPRPAEVARPVATPESKPGPVAAKPPPATADGQRWWVQIGSYSDIGNARQVETRLRGIGQPAVIAPIDTARGTLYRVRGGPYSSEPQAQAAQALIVRNGYADARVVKP